jgi:hypothetical protein
LFFGTNKFAVELGFCEGTGAFHRLEPFIGNELRQFRMTTDVPFGLNVESLQRHFPKDITEIQVGVHDPLNVFPADVTNISFVALHCGIPNTIAPLSGILSV